MATSYDTYKKQYLKDKSEDKIIDINAVQNQAEQQKQAVTESYNTGIAETQASYENAFRQNEVQRALNERYLERKAAEMGLTDSGMNRTQQTANQLSYGNQKATLTTQKQKAIDTLAAAMRAKIADIDTAEKADIRAIEKQYDANAEQYATNMYKADLEAETERYKAQVEAAKNVKTNALNAYNNLYKALEAGSIASVDERARQIYNLGITYGDYIDDAQASMLYQLARITEEQFDRFVDGTGIKEGAKTVTYGSTNVIDAKTYSDRVKEAVKGKKTEDEIQAAVNAIAATNDIDGGWSKDVGELYYKVKIEKDTAWNWWWGADTDDRITIYYPDGKTVVEGFENIKLGKLPKELRRDLSDEISGGFGWDGGGDRDGESFYYSMDLSDVDL